MSFRKVIPFILYWCLCTTLAAQTSEIDSLEQVLASGKVNLVEKVELLAELSHKYFYVDTVKSRMYALDAIKLAQNAGSVEGTAYKALGRYYQATDQPYPAYVNYKKAEKLYIEFNDNEELYNIYNNLMVLFSEIEDRENSVYFAERLQEMAAERGDLSRELTAQFYLGWARLEYTERQEALDFFKDIYEKSLPLDNPVTYFLAVQCGRVYVRMNRPHEALPYLHRASKYYGSNLPETFGYLALAYAMIQQNDSAEYYIKKAGDSHLLTDNTQLILLQSRSQIEENHKNYKKALEIYKLYHYLSDSIAIEEKTTEIAQMKNWKELEHKDRENLILQQGKEKQQKFIIVLAMSLVLIFMLFVVVVFYHKKATEKNEELKQLHTVKDKLFSVVAHDLRSPMGALVSVLKLANKNRLDPETQAQLLKDITSRVEDTYGLLDNLLRWSKSQMQGMTLTPVYFDVHEGSLSVTDTLQTIAAGKKITLDNRIEKHQIFADRDMFAVLVRNLTMNAIKYTSAKGVITLDSELKDNMLIVSVKDTGTGMPQEV